MIWPGMPTITAGNWLAADTLALISLNDELAACISSKLNLLRRCGLMTPVALPNLSSMWGARPGWAAN